ncbi:uncharacterized protein FPRO_14189 [Fusarium proliferatum ET1]|uniref:Hydrophobin n=1 Tax=Fusarium proliferatum (strain ET1) TaxID=1227346 RepID=A0A1L7VWR0_FUSPR|nr:uncharacterized protein FPRO_14189 [Fusarium proliferatum ET1]CZR44436.1 uncharacterized protein FPRO_14189 [Fusarium proliferatum ET1]
MKASLILALPALAIAAATPQMEERQLPTRSVFNAACLLKIPGILECLPGLNVNSDIGIFDVFGCAEDLLDDITACLNVRLPTVPGTK